MKIKKYIDNESLLIEVDGKIAWQRDFKSGKTTMLNQEYFQAYRENWSKADYSETPDLVLVDSLIKMRTNSESDWSGFISDGSRPNHIFYEELHRRQSNWIGDVRTQNGIELRPGDQGNAVIRFLFDTPIEEFLEEGRIWWLRRGDIIMADCEMKKINITHNIM